MEIVRVVMGITFLHPPSFFVDLYYNKSLTSILLQQTLNNNLIKIFLFNNTFYFNNT